MDRLTALALRAKTGDRRALDSFVQETRSDVLRLCRYLGSPSDPDDLTQETFERAIRSLHTFRGEGPARSWLLSIARRVCVDSTRAAIRGRNLVEKTQAITRPEPVHDYSWFEIDELLADLPDERREAFVLTQIVGMSYQETADVVGCAIGTIRSRVARARRQLLDDDAVARSLSA